MAEITEASEAPVAEPRSAEDAGSQLLQDETHYEGRYIPYSGGSAGWFENSGVPKSERGNNYAFHTAIDEQLVHQKRFERLGQDVNHRLEQRQLMDGETPISLQWDDQSVSGTMRDFTGKGMRVRIVEDTGLSVGDAISVRIHPNAFFKNELALIDCEIIWIRRLNIGEGVYHVGISYAEI